MDKAYITSEIKKVLSTKEVFEFYGLKPNNKGFVCCFEHAEKTPSMKVYDGDRGYFCFGCNASGDIIDFVKKYFNLNFMQALKKLNDDFSLGLPINRKMTAREREQMALRAFERKRQATAIEEKKKRIESDYWSAYDGWLQLDNILRAKKPKNPAFASPEYIQALIEIENAKQRLAMAERELHEYEQRNR